VNHDTDHITQARDALVRAGRALEILERRVAALEDGERERAERLVAAERHAGRLMSLYVATYQLHSTLEPREVQATIGDIAVNLLGAEHYALLVRSESGAACEVAAGAGTDHAVGFTGGRYTGGDPAIDATLADGRLRIGPLAGSSVVAVVPLVIHGTTVGAVVLLTLLSHRPPIDDEDRELFDLVSAHAASALLAARAFATTDRKLRTLQGLVQMVRGGRS
jgi:GAF domain-containing protein